MTATKYIVDIKWLNRTCSSKRTHSSVTATKYIVDIKWFERLTSFSSTNYYTSVTATKYIVDIKWFETHITEQSARRNAQRPQYATANDRGLAFKSAFSSAQPQLAHLSLFPPFPPFPQSSTLGAKERRWTKYANGFVAPPCTLAP